MVLLVISLADSLSRHLQVTTLPCRPSASLADTVRLYRTKVALPAQSTAFTILNCRGPSASQSRLPVGLYLAEAYESQADDHYPTLPDRDTSASQADNHYDSALQRSLCQRERHLPRLNLAESSPQRTQRKPAWHNIMSWSHLSVCRLLSAFPPNEIVYLTKIPLPAWQTFNLALLTGVVVLSWRRRVRPNSDQHLTGAIVRTFCSTTFPPITG